MWWLLNGKLVNNYSLDCASKNSPMIYKVVLQNGWMDDFIYPGPSPQLRPWIEVQV